MTKTEVLRIVEDFSDGGEVDLDGLIYTLDFRREVERGMAVADARDEVSLDEFEERSEQWLASL